MRDACAGQGGHRAQGPRAATNNAAASPSSSSYLARDLAALWAGNWGRHGPLPTCRVLGQPHRRRNSAKPPRPGCPLRRTDGSSSAAVGAYAPTPLAPACLKVALLPPAWAPGGAAGCWKGPWAGGGAAGGSQGEGCPGCLEGSLVDPVTASPARRPHPVPVPVMRGGHTAPGFSRMPFSPGESGSVASLGLL